MPFAYYRRLGRRQQAIYRNSDAVSQLPLPDAAALEPIAAELERGLLADDRMEVRRHAQALADAVLGQLRVPAVGVMVLATRPGDDESELHGLYQREEGKRATIRVWMRTAVREQPVAFRTFVRTLFHELVHHLDYEWLKLADSFHTHGFYRREAHLARQLLNGWQSPKREAPARQLELELG